jgi:dephospho-CoA kinase
MTDRGRAVRIGITGPIGCGKSAVAGWLGERPGVVVVDADRIARDVLEPGTAEVEAVYRRFGEGLRTTDGSLDRAALAEMVFADPAALHDLERIVHPAVRPRILARMAEADRAGASAIVIEAIKLVDGGLAELCDDVWLVTCRREVQLERLLGRGTAREDALSRIDAQAGIIERVGRRATWVVEADGPIAALRPVVVGRLDDVLAGRREADGS